MQTKMIVVLSAVSVVLVGCGEGRAKPRAEASSPAAPPAQTATGTGTALASPAARQYDIRGRVESISRERASVTLDHEEIPGLMAAMKMEYKLADAAIIDRIAVGDSVAGRLEDRSGSYVIVSLHKR